MAIEQFVFNLGGAKLRRDFLEGNECLVVPTVMLTQGVHSGNQGPILYTNEELGKNPSDWNHIPVVLYHPQVNGKMVSARSQNVLNTRKLGVILNSQFSDDKLKTETWLDIKRTNKIDPTLIPKLEKGEKVEVSTGLYSNAVGPAGEWNGTKYTVKATDFKPDHLAILPTGVGACSIAKGAGLLANACISQELLIINQVTAKNEGFPIEDYGEPETKSFLVNCQLDLDMAFSVLGHANDPELVSNRLKEIAQRKGLKLPEDAVDELNPIPVTNASYSKTESLLSKHLETIHGYSAYVRDVYPDSVIFSKSSGGMGTSKMYHQNYAIDENNNVTLSGDPKEVNQVTQYKTPDGKLVANSSVPVTNKEKPNMDRKAYLASLLANGFTQVEIDVLSTLTDENLQKIQPKKTVVANATVEQKPLTWEMIVANADTNAKDVLNELNETYITEKTGLITKITANSNNPYTADELKEKTVKELKKLAKLSGSTSGTGVVANMLGAWVPNSQAVSSSPKISETPGLAMPVMNFGK